MRDINLTDSTDQLWNLYFSCDLRIKLIPTTENLLIWTISPS